jgi:hypothetical protein
VVYWCVVRAAQEATQGRTSLAMKLDIMDLLIHLGGYECVEDREEGS